MYHCPVRDGLRHKPPIHRRIFFDESERLHLTSFRIKKEFCQSKTDPPLAEKIFIKTHSIMTILELIHTAAKKLSSEGITNPKTSSEILLSRVLNTHRLNLYIDYDQSVSLENEKLFWKLIHRRAQHEPLQYILGETEFMSLPFMVNPSVLIPRPETELLAETVISYCKTLPAGVSPRIIDVGTGSGNIAVSAACYIPNASVIGLDCSEKALTTAHINAQDNEVSHKTTFMLCNILSDNITDNVDLTSADAVVSNPPYILPQEYPLLPREVREFEPAEALEARGDDGLEFYTVIMKLAHRWLKEGGMIAFEVSPSVGSSVVDIVDKAGFRNIQLKQDYAHLDRIVTGIRKS